MIENFKFVKEKKKCQSDVPEMGEKSNVPDMPEVIPSLEHVVPTEESPQNKKGEYIPWDKTDYRELDEDDEQTPEKKPTIH